MKPHYEAHGITLYVADARDVLPTMPRGSVDLLLTDPPYGVNAAAHGYRTRPLALAAIAHDDSPDVGAEIVALGWPLLRRSRQAYVFGPFPLDGLPNAGSCCELVWDKGHFGGGDTASPWGKSHEFIQFGIRLDGPLAVARARIRTGSVLRHSRPGQSDHITEKPVPLLRELIERGSHHGETVLDPCAGSGSTLVAALIEGRKAIGIELEVEWADVAAERLRKLTEQGNLFAWGTT